MFCKQCGSEVVDGTAFCAKCGKPLEQQIQQKSTNCQSIPRAKKDKSTTSMILGIIGMFAWMLPIVGLPISICGLVFGIKNLEGERKGRCIVGICLSSISLILSVVNCIAGILKYGGML